MPRQDAGTVSEAPLTALETIDATGGGCEWTIYRKEEGDRSRAGQLVEHACTGDRFEVDPLKGWLHDGDAVSMLHVLGLLPPELIEWALREALETASDEELTPLGIDLARVILLAGHVTDLVGDVRRRRRGRFRRRPARAA